MLAGMDALDIVLLTGSGLITAWLWFEAWLILRKEKR